MSRRWALQWREMLDSARPGHELRLTRGRLYQRSGRVVDLRVEQGLLTGRVQGSRSTPYTVRIEVPVLDDDAWEAFVEAVAGQARHSARLLAGLAPDGIEQQLHSTRIELFPAARRAWFACECADTVAPCAHGIALWEETAQRIAAEPAVLLRLRGRGRQQLLAEVAAARQGGQEEPQQETVRISDLDVQGWWSARSRLEDIAIPWPNPPPTPAPTLRLAGDPPGWAGGVGAWDLLRPLIERAGAWAEDLAAGG